MNHDRTATLALRASRMENLGLLPEIASRVMELTQSPNVSVQQIEKIVSRDVALATKVLKVANSSYYGGKNVYSLNRAIMCLGLNSVRQLTFTAAFQQVTMHRPSAKSFDARRFWGHSLGAAVLARGLSRHTPLIAHSEELYLAALLHDIGILMLDRLAPELLETVLSEAFAENRPVHIICSRLFGFDHAELGAQVVRHWGFGERLASAIEFQYHPEDAGQYEMDAALIGVANAAAHGNGLLNQGPASDIAMPSIELLQLTPAAMEVAVSELIVEISDAQATFAVQCA